jgi:hypothetical protein
MAKRPRRGQAFEQLGDFLPEPSTKAPKAPKTRAELQAKEEQWGKPTSARLTVQERDALESLAADFETDLTQIMRLCLRIGISAIEAGIFKPKFAEQKARKIVKMPALPERFV